MKNTDFLKNSLIAHRGLHNNLFPENSIAAFNNAVSYNFGIELDISVLKDGTIICFHDNNLKRMTGLNQNLNNLSYDDIKDLKLNNTNETIPKFSDVLTLIDGRVPLLIEVKAHKGYKKSIKKIGELINNYSGDVAVFSFSPVVVKWFKKHYPNLIRGQITSYFNHNKKMPKLLKLFMKRMSFNKFTKPDFISYDNTNLPNKYADKALNKGIVVISYTARSNDEFKRIKSHYHNIVFEEFIPR